MLDLWSPAIADDLLRFVLYVYPWGKAGTPLEGFSGPRKWQCEDLDEISQHIRNNKLRPDLGLTPEMFRKASVTGRGTGKTALLSWMIHWFMTTRVGSSTIVTANTEPQLKTKTWAELGRWHTLSINAHWFDRAALSMRPAKWFEEAIKRDLKIDTGYYYAQAQLWSAENPDAFAGAHNPLGLMLLMDEASGIEKKIFSVSEGFFSEPTPDRYWLIFSNGRRSSGAFFDCFHQDAKYWRRRQLDSRTVEGVDQALFARIIEKYGADSDEARIEVYGQFPDQSDLQFIANDLVWGAQKRELVKDPGAALIMGVDISRGSRDASVIRWRQGRDARSIAPQRKMERDAVVLADWIAGWIDATAPDGVNIDGGDIGAAVADILRSRGYRMVESVMFGSNAIDKKVWDDKGTEMWADTRDWLAIGCLDDSPVIFSDLTQREKRRVGKAGERIRLESKDDMRDRGLDSPDDGDALALTFARKIARRDANRGRGGQTRQARDVDYALFGG